MSSSKSLLVSACIIARDEAHVIGRCLSSVREACDEACVVDTGSCDRTAAIALAADAKVVRSTECNDRLGRITDFSLARNRSLELAAGQWVLWIDADEVLLPSSASIIRHYAVKRTCDAVRVRLENGSSYWPAVRLFRRTPRARFVGIVHESPMIHGRIITEPGIVIRNLPNKRGKESAVDRDLRLCARALVGHSNNARMLLYMARALQRSGALDEAIKYYERYLQTEYRFRPGRHFCQHGIAVCHLLASRWKEARVAADRATDIDPARADSHCVAGDAYLALRRLADAVTAYQRALACPLPAEDYPIFTNPIFYSRYPRQQLRFIRGLA